MDFSMYGLPASYGMPAPVQPQIRPDSGSPSQKTLWVGDLDTWVDENTLYSMFSMCHDQVVNVKLIREKGGTQSAGYGFVEFVTHDAAKAVLDALDGQPIAINPSKRYRLNWSQQGKQDMQVYSIFVGDLASDVTDYLLESTFRSRYPSVCGAKVVTDSNTGKVKGYGFVRFTNEMEMLDAMKNMQGQVINGRAVRVSTAVPKAQLLAQQAGLAPAAIPTPTPLKAPTPSATASIASGSPLPPELDPANTTLFVGGIDSSVTIEQLRMYFLPFGEIATVKIPPGKGCGFVQFMTRASAETAMKSLNQTMIGPSRVRISWGKSPQALPAGAQKPAAPAPAPAYDPAAAAAAWQQYQAYQQYCQSMAAPAAAASSASVAPEAPRRTVAPVPKLDVAERNSQYAAQQESLLLSSLRAAISPSF